VAEAAVGFLDVGHGSCTVAWDLQRGSGIIVDCPPWGVSVAASFIAQAEISAVEVAISTHSHLDHIGGIYALSQRARPKEIRYNLDTRRLPAPAQPKLEATLRGFLALHKEGIALGSATLCESGTCGCLRWHVIAPTHDELTAAWLAGDPNRASAIVLLSTPNHVFVIPGDADNEVWQRLLRERVPLAADGLLLPHHGGELGKSVAAIRSILDAVDPSFCVVSAGSHARYRHPANDAVDALLERGLAYAATNARREKYREGESGRPTGRGTIRVLSGAQGLRIDAPEVFDEPLHLPREAHS
jgi:competence protein ComEC